ncbi:MAG: YkgJ family cysteine cluster protein [Steroidobacteraceae bacterium]
MSSPSYDSSGTTVDAGPFGAWLADARASLRGSVGAKVPCGDCVGCCVSSYHIPLRATDAAAIERIPGRHLVQSRAGTLHIQYRPDGLCPMLEAGHCTIYPHRPQTCRDYDCRFFAAAGIEAGGAERSVINTRVRQWRFTYPSPADQRAHDAVRSAAAFLQREASRLPPGFAPAKPTGIAVLAVKTYMVFLDPDAVRTDAAKLAQAVVEASQRFDADIDE